MKVQKIPRFKKVTFAGNSNVDREKVIIEMQKEVGIVGMSKGYVAKWLAPIFTEGYRFEVTDERVVRVLKMFFDEI